MKPRPLRAGHRAGRVNVTPMIDVVMCLIIFYMLVGKLVLDTRSDVFLPESRSGTEEREADTIVVNIVPRDGGAAIVVDGRDIPAALLEGLLRDRLERRPESIVQVRGGRDLPWGEIAPLVDACRGLGIAEVHLAAERAR